MVSIIVPVYNIERFLRLALDSVLKSTYQDFELILVDDGSSDASPAICDEYASADPRVRVIHKANGGVSSARNEGLSVARGEYISFVDGDDMIHPLMLENLVNAIEQGEYEFSMCYLKRIHEGKDAEAMQGDIKTPTIKELNANEYSRCIYGQNDNETIQYHVVYNKLYKRELVEGQRFCELKSGEDTVWNHQVCLKMNQAVLVEAELYYYIQHSTSLTHESMNPNYYDWIRSYDVCLGLIPQQDVEFRKNCLLQLYKVMASIRYKSHQTPFDEEVKALNADIAKRTLHEFKHSSIDWFTKFRLLTFHYQPWTYRLFMKGCDLVAKCMRR